MNHEYGPVARRVTTTTATTTVSYVAKPMGRARENGPHLADLREFVALCDGLPDDLLVWIGQGHLDEGGRHDVTFRVAHRVPVAAPTTTGGAM